MTLKHDLQSERLAAYFKLRGGWPFPLAGAIWWATLTAAGYLAKSPQQWAVAALFTSALIAPLAMLIARLARNPLMSERTAVTDVIFPAFVGMLLFWPIAISALWSCLPLFPLVVAIGMSMHWPVIGWSYGRPQIYIAHAVIRAVACFIIWNWLPECRYTLMPMAISILYVLTVIALLIDTRGRARA